MFNREDFLKALEMQCKTFNLSPGQVWQIADNVFAAMMRSLDSTSMEWTVIYYFDDREVKMRDDESGKQNMAREVQLLMLGGFTYGSLSEDPDDHVRIAYFNDDPTGCNPEYVVNYASHLFAKKDNDEVGWFDLAIPMPFSMTGR